MKKPAASKPKGVTAPFSIRLNPVQRAALIKAGEAEDRAAAYIAQRAVVDWLKSNRFLK